MSFCLPMYVLCCPGNAKRPVKFLVMYFSVFSVIMYLYCLSKHTHYTIVHVGSHIKLIPRFSKEYNTLIAASSLYNCRILWSPIHIQNMLIVLCPVTELVHFSTELLCQYVALELLSCSDAVMHTCEHCSKPGYVLHSLVPSPTLER